MAQPQKINSQIFEQDQQPAYEVLYWDTVYPVVQVSEVHGEERDTAFGSGMEFSVFDLLVPSFNPANKAELDAALNATRDGNGNREIGTTYSVLDYNEDDTYRVGVAPLMYDFWGGGTVEGAGRAKHVLLRYAGYAKRDVANATFVFGGQGNVRAYVNGSEIVAGRLREPTLTSWGYQYNDSPVSLSEGDYVEVYYWQAGEPWGGFFGKLISEPVTRETLLSALRDAPLIGTSIISREQENLPSLAIPYITSVSLDRDTEGIAKASIEVGVTVEGEADGFYWDAGKLISNATGEMIRVDRMVHIRTGFVRPDGTDELYNRLTGTITNILPPQDGKVRIEVMGIEAFMERTFDENCPDFLSYHAAGFVRRTPSNEPVFGVPAYDNWPLEVALADLCYRAGIDPYCLGKVNGWGRAQYTAFTTGDTYYGAPLFSARALVEGEKKVTIERQVNYGNVGPYRDTNMPVDDSYLFSPDIQRNVYDRAKEISNHYGYDFYFNSDGYAVIGARNNPVAFQLMTQTGDYLTTTDGQYESVHPSAVGARYLYRTFSDGNWSRTVVGHFSRLDLYMGVGPDRVTGLNGGLIRVLVERHVGGGVYETVPGFPSAVSSFLDVDSEKFYYDDVTYETGENAAVVTLFNLPFDNYRVTLAPLGPHPGEVNCVYRLNGVGVYEHDSYGSAYVTDEGAPRFLSTLDNLLSLAPESAREELRNHVVVIGARKATITDSEKVGQDPGQNNPDAEFHVAVAVDPFSIYDPTSENFVGQKRSVVNFDSKIADSDFARWLTRVVLYRYRNPQAGGQVEHTLLPNIELRDPVYVVNEKDESVNGRFWVTGIREAIDERGAITELQLFPYPEIPSYQPREEVDVDALFEGNPVINLEVTYENIYGEVVTNEDLTDPAEIEGFHTKMATESENAPMYAEAISNANTHVAANKVIPETTYLSWNIANTNASKDAVPLVTGRFEPRAKKRVLVNNPYRHFYHMTWSNGVPTFTFDFQEGDGTAGVYDKAYYGFPNIDGQYYLCYDALRADRGRTNPFYDPYSSEVGNYIRISFTALVSGRYRVSVWDARRAGGVETPVAYLTVPAAESTDPNAHWMYLDPSANIEFFWDGVDNIGEWNRKQSRDFSREIEGAFGEDESTTVGRGFYAWNDQSTRLHTLIGDDTARNFGSDGSPYYTIGQFGQFYVKVEVLNDELIGRDIDNGLGATPRTVSSESLSTTGGQNSTSEIYVFTHLPEPTQVGIKVEDYVGASPWSRGTEYDEADWEIGTDGDATIREGKPLRVTFYPVARRGYHFGEDEDNVTGKLTRIAQLKATILDQFWTFKGTPWAYKYQELQSAYNFIEEKRLTSRMFHNDDHVVSFADGSWLTGSEMRQLEWVFDPSEFEKDFGDGVEEALEYGNYEQLETLPGFTARPSGGIGKTERSYMLLAYMSYIFYLSSFVLDRSGRRQWCIHRFDDGDGVHGFIDKTKIVTPSWLTASGDPSSISYKPEYILDYPRAGADRYLVRTIIARQWVEPSWGSSTNPYPSSPVAQYNITDAQHLTFVQPKFKDFWYADSVFADPTNRAGALDRHLQTHTIPGHSTNEYVSNRPVATVTVLPSPYLIPYNRMLGTWDFDRKGVEGFFTPAPARDFHPYWRASFMADWATHTTDVYFTDKGSDAFAIPSSNFDTRTRDVNSQDTWFAVGFSEAYAAGVTDYFGFRVEQTVEEWVNRERPLERVRAAYNYARQDTLDRYEGFRGVYASGPIGDRFKGYIAWNAREVPRSTPNRKTARQPVMPVGTYFLNLGNYNAFVHGRPSSHDTETLPRHFVGIIDNFFDLRFRSEYAWYSDNFFPVNSEGQAVYGFTGNEYTRAFDWQGAPWWALLSLLFRRTHVPLPELFYDSGAWVGWKDDIESANWTGNNARLRWAYEGAFEVNSTVGQRQSGGAGYVGTSADETHWGYTHTYAMRNILDEYFSAGIMKLAVGPRCPETSDVIMNLVLPARLRG